MTRAQVGLAVALGMIVTHTAVWAIVADRVSEGFSSWVDWQRASGVEVDVGATTWTGWPLAAGVAVSDLTLKSAAVRLHTPGLAVVLRSTDPFRVHLLPAGPQSASAGPTTIGLAAESFDLGVNVSDGGDPSLRAQGLRLDTPLGMFAAGHVSGRIVADPGTAAGETHSFAAEAGSIQFPAGWAPPLGQEIEAVSVAGSIAGPLSGAATLRRQLILWRDAHGTATVSRFGFRWGRLSADGAGSATFDAALQPVADLSVRLSGQNEALSAMTAQGAISVQTAFAARAVLALFARAQPGPDGRPAPLPLTLRDGTLALAGFPVARLPAIEWR